MVNLTIDGKKIVAAPGTTILEAAKLAGIDIPSICYLKDICEIGACRICVVEVEGYDRLAASCNTAVEEGMVVRTNSPRVRRSRKMNTQLILSQHQARCTNCIRSGICRLQTVANGLGLLRNSYKLDIPPVKWNLNYPLYRDEGRCVRCMRCVQVCDNIQSLNVWDVVNTGSRTTVGVKGSRKIEESNCSLCGQCITHCPVGALRERDDTNRVFDALADPDVITVVQIAPAVRTAWAEQQGLSGEEATPERMVAALKQMGFDYIFDTNFSADLTIMEEGSEFLERFASKDKPKYPLFTSCCPGWVRFIKSEFPDMVENLSTAKSPQQMFGAVAKTYFAEKIGIDPGKIFHISIMPCLAKKHECDLETMRDAGAGKDVDVVLTTREFARMIREEHIDIKDLPEIPFDDPLGVGTGAAVIFGATGGVMEAALRTAYYIATGEKAPIEAFYSVRGMDGWKEAEFTVAGSPLRVAVASGLGNARKLLEAIKRGEAKYDFVEIMACPGGCGGGGGQPINIDAAEMAEERENYLYFLDANNPIRCSFENPEIVKLYESYFEKPLSHRAHELLHTDHEAWSMPR